MSEGWLVQEALIFISQYLHEVDSSRPHSFSISSTRGDNRARMEGNVPQGKGVQVTMDVELLQRLNTFCILNSEMMKPWVAKYEDAKSRIQEERSQFRKRNGRHAPFPPT